MKTIIEMAREAGVFTTFNTLHPSIEIFAELVRADERETIVEAINKLMMEVDQAPRTPSTKMASFMVRSIGNQFLELIHARSDI